MKSVSSGGFDHHVLGLEIAVEDAEGVRLGERGQHLGNDLHHPRGLEREILGDELQEVAAREVLHGEEERAVLGLPEVDDGDGVRVVEARGGPGLAVEALHDRRVREERALEDLERDRPIQREVGGLVDLAHPAAAEELVDEVLLRHRLADVGIARVAFLGGD
jgi:hypothetical protein